MVKTNKLNRLIFSIGKRYGTFNPFAWAEKLNLEIDWINLDAKPLAKTIYFLDEPVIMMSDSIRYSKQRYFVLAHELGHVLEHEGLSAYYISNIMYISVKLNVRQIILRWF